MANENRKTSFKKVLTFVKLSHIPGPRGKKYFSYVRNFQKDILGSFTQVHRDYGDIASFAWPMNSVIIYSPEMVKQVLVDDAHSYIKGEQIEELKAVVGNGLATNNDQRSWLRNRSLISREFSPRAVQATSAQMQEIISKNVDQLQGTQIDICDQMKKWTFEIACKIFLGLDAADEDSQLVNQAVEFTSNVTYERIFQFFPLPYWLPTEKHRQFNAQFNNLDRIVSKVIAQAQTPDQKPSVLSRLVKAIDPETQTSLGRSELRDEILTIMLAGHETSAHTLSWCFTLLAAHPEIQQKVFLEIKDIDLSAPTSVMDQTPYLQKVLHESMRLYPAFPVLSRKTRQATALGPYRLPAHTNVVIPIYVMQRSEKLFQDALRFDPDRFNSGEHLKSFSYLPFSRGTRRCIGEVFAMTEMSLILISLLQKFQLGYEEESLPKEVAAVSLKARDKYHLTIRSRQA